MDPITEHAEPRRKTRAQPEPTAEREETSQLSLDAETTVPLPLEDGAQPGAIRDEELLAPVLSDESGPPAAPSRADRRRLEEQLEALKRREFELRRALAVADHPEVADAVRALEGRAYAVASIEGRMAQGLSKSEERRLDTLQKKLAAARAKRSELEVQIAELEAEVTQLANERRSTLEAERREALCNLMMDMRTYDDALRGAGLDAGELVPEIARLLPEILSLAQELASPRGSA